MEIYPQSPKISTMQTEIDDGSRETRAASGNSKIARLYDDEYYLFTLNYVVLTNNDVAVLTSFYSAEKYNDVEFVHPVSQQRFRVRMLAPPQITDTSYIYSTVTMRLRGTLIIDG